jgi:hypothetical protein
VPHPGLFLPASSLVPGHAASGVHIQARSPDWLSMLCNATLRHRQLLIPDCRRVRVFRRRPGVAARLSNASHIECWMDLPALSYSDGCSRWVPNATSSRCLSMKKSVTSPLQSAIVEHVRDSIRHPVFALLRPWQPATRSCHMKLKGSSSSFQSGRMIAEPIRRRHPCSPRYPALSQRCAWYIWVQPHSAPHYQIQSARIHDASSR